jgi:hypothetical protein
MGGFVLLYGMGLPRLCGIGFLRKHNGHTLFSITCVASSDRPGQRRRRSIFMGGDERSCSWAVSFCCTGWAVAWTSDLWIAGGVRGSR